MNERPKKDMSPLTDSDQDALASTTVDGEDSALKQMGNATQEDAQKDIRTDEAPFTHPSNLGQQDAAGGSESAPETDDDVGEMMEKVFGKPDLDGIDPQPVDIARDIDEAEESLRTH
jgi:hypothetical protein